MFKILFMLLKACFFQLQEKIFCFLNPTHVFQFFFLELYYGKIENKEII